MSARTIALQLRTLAADPASQGMLLAEASCLSGLVTLLHADNEEDVLILSLQALAFLAANPSNHAGLVNAPGLLVALTTLTEKPAVVLKTLAQNVMAALECYINGGVACSTPGSATPTLGARGGRTPTLGASGRGSRDNSRPATRAGKEDPTGSNKLQQDSADKENHDNQMSAVSAAPSKPSYLKKTPVVSASPAVSSASSSSSSGPSRPGYLSTGAAAHTGGSRALAVHATASSASDSASSLAARYQAQQAAKKKAEAAAAAAAPVKKGGMLAGITSYFW